MKIKNVINFFCFVFLAFLTPTNYALEVPTIFGPLKLEGNLLEIYNTEQIQRLKGIDCSGTPAYWGNTSKFNRLELSLGILWLVTHFGGDVKEQAAALVSYISYTVFSQTADVVFGVKDYQNATTQKEFLESTEIGKLIHGLDLTPAEIATCEEFKRLTQPSPNMCADNIAYSLQLALALKFITKSNIEKMLKSLRFDDSTKRWFFTSRKSAKKFAKILIRLAKEFWCSSDNAVMHHITSLILKRALQLQRITLDDLKSSTDKQILDKLSACDDLTIKRLVAKAKFIKKAYRILQETEGTPDFVPKFKVLIFDPWICDKHTKEFKKLSDIDKKFKKQKEEAEQFCKQSPKIQLEINN